MPALRGLLACFLAAAASAAPASAGVVQRQGTALPALAQSSVALEIPALGPGKGAGPVFVDAAKQAAPWTSTMPLELDRLGYPTSLAAGQSAESVIYLNDAHPGGDFTLLYSGHGTLEVDGAAVVQRAPGRMVVRVPADARRVALRMTSTDAKDYLHDVHFVLPGFEQSFASEPFHPQFLQSLRGVGILRFGLWMHGATYAKSAVSVLRPTTGTYTQAGAAGVAPEYVAALANAVGADPWLTLPAGATDGYVYMVGDVMHHRLDPRLHALIEYADLAWQAGTPSNGWAVMAGHNMRLSGDDQRGALEWYALRSTQVFAVALRSFGADANRIVRVLSGPLDDTAALRTVLGYAGAAGRADAFFVTAPAREGAGRLLAATRLRTLFVGNVRAAVADAAAHRASVVPNLALRFVPTAAADEAVESRRETKLPRPGPPPAKANATPEREPQGPELIGDLGDPLPGVNLTREGTADWVHWGRVSSRPDRKASGGEAIAGFGRMGNGAATRETSFAAYRWSDGALRKGESGTRTGVALTGAGAGFTMSAPADETLRTLRVYVGARGAQGRFTARLTDAGARPYVDASLDDDASGHTGVYTLEYRASKPGQRLLVTFAAARVYRSGGRVSLESATLQDGRRPNPATTPTDMTMFHNDNSRSGWNPNESTLTVKNVASSSFGALTTLNVDGVVLAQPLYLYQYAFPSEGTHNVLFVATENNTLYEYDADTFQLINSRNFGPSQNSGDVGCADIQPTYGITSTPVINRSTDTIYLVAATEPASGDFVATIHAVDIGTLADQQTPVVIAASVKMSNGSTIDFEPQNQQSRTSLAFANNSLYVGIGSHCDNYAGNIIGWMLKYDPTLKQTAAFATGEDSSSFLLDSIWMAGYASAIDANGNIFSVTGNGAFDAASGGRDFGESAIKLDPNLTGVQTSFTPSDWEQLNNGDTDFGSGGIMLLPPQQGSTPNVAVAMGKDSVLFLLNQDSLGGVGNPLEQINTGGGGVWGGPAFFSGPKGQFVYYQTGGAQLIAYKVTATRRGATRLVQATSGSSIAGYGGSSPVVSSNGQQKGTGIVWLVKRDTTLTLEAYNALNLDRMIFSGNAGSWGNPANNGFVTPLVANGKVYVPAQGTVTVFGLH